ncbi:GNAT family N-acetyltransferase [Streptomyces sp. NPDC096198]|uniref:GNAT family N-acetyltransferase n=1 Tax=Streptomyces sp. NPDC096198 TaxID=3366080 RepID=UPI0038300C4D
MNPVLRPGTAGDVAECARICFEAFSRIAREHGFPPDIPSQEAATGAFEILLNHPGIHSVVAELDGRIVGSNFLDERSPIVAPGPLSVDPAVQAGGVGRALIQDVMERAAEHNGPGVRLVQNAYHARTFGIYAGRLGFEFREALVCLQGPPIGGTVPGYGVRCATEADLDACNEVCRKVHGIHRAGEVLDALKAGTARVTEHDGRITGYATDLSFFGHAVGESTEDIRALIMAAPAFGGPGILVPARNSALLQWCLRHGLKVNQLMNLMSTGLYNEPAGAHLSSILY